jgi:hypothetical protein
MTQYRKDPDATSNWFDRLFDGIGHRGSSFSDIDGYIHDARTDRILLMEFKWHGNVIPKGQAMGLRSFARRDGIIVWCLKRLPDDRVKALDLSHEEFVATIDGAQAQHWLKLWWDNRTVTLRELASGDARHSGVQACRHKDEFKQDGRCWICTHMRRTA